MCHCLIDKEPIRFRLTNMNTNKNSNMESENPTNTPFVTSQNAFLTLQTFPL